MQELACYLGQGEVFDKASEVLKKTTGADLCDKQIERTCHRYGQLLGDAEATRIACGSPCADIKKGERYYGMLDGGMVLTREGGWKELKLARIMNEQSVLRISDKRGWIRSSIYVAHLGGHKDFLKKVEWYIDEVTDLVIVGDGAPWIWNWAQELYPSSTQILDFFHAKEHLCCFAKLWFEDAVQRSLWIEIQTSLMLEGKMEQVIENIEALGKSKKTDKEKQRQALVNYYSTNINRMRYKTFRESGLMIGSGPIEAAHRNVIQERMKRSGQRWTSNGAQQMANLRVAMESNNWWTVEELIRKTA